MELSDGFNEALYAVQKEPLSYWEVYDSEANRWLILEDIVSFDIESSRDDNRPILYTAMPPASRVKLRLMNRDRRYSFGRSDSPFASIIKADTMIRAFIGYKTEGAERSFVLGAAPPASTEKDYYAGFDSAQLMYNFALDSEELLCAQGFCVSEDTATELGLSTYANAEYGSSKYEGGSVYVSRSFRLSFNSTRAQLLSFHARFEYGSPSDVLVSYRSISTNAEPSEWSAPFDLSDPPQLNLPADLLEVKLSLKNSLCADVKLSSFYFKVSTGYEVYPAFKGLIDIPKIISSSHSSYLELSGRGLLKKVFDERLGAHSFESSITLEDAVKGLLLRSSYINEDMLGVFDETGITIEPAAAITFEAGRTLRENLNAVLETAYSYDEESSTVRVFRLYADRRGKLHLRKTDISGIAKGVFSYNKNMKELRRYEDVYKMINQQTVIGESSPTEYSEQLVASEAVSLADDEFEKEVELSLSVSPPAPAGSPLTYINYSHDGGKDVLLYEKENSRGVDAVTLIARNKSYAGVNPQAQSFTINVYATPVNGTSNYTAEAFDQGSVEKYGKRTAATIKSPFVSSSARAMNLARAVVSYRKEPLSILELSFVNGTFLPYVELNDAYRVFEKESGLYDIYNVTSVRHYWNSSSLGSSLSLESAGIQEGLQQYDSYYGGYEQDLFYDSGRLYDEELKDSSEQQLEPFVVFSVL